MENILQRTLCRYPSVESTLEKGTQWATPCREHNVETWNWANLHVRGNLWQPVARSPEIAHRCRLVPSVLGSHVSPDSAIAFCPTHPMTSENIHFPTKLFTCSFSILQTSVNSDAAEAYNGLSLARRRWTVWGPAGPRHLSICNLANLNPLLKTASAPRTFLEQKKYREE